MVDDGPALVHTVASRPRPSVRLYDVALESEDIRAITEALVELLEKRGFIGPVAAPTRILDTTEVARMLGRDRQWVYDHAAELGAFRFGDGPKARLGFDLAVVERWKRGRQVASTPSKPPRRGRPARVQLRERPSFRSRMSPDGDQRW